MKTAKIVKCLSLIMGILFVFNNCGENTLGPTVEIDLSKKIYYKAQEPNYPQACIEVQIPVDIKQEDIKAEVLRLLAKNDFDEQINGSIESMEAQLNSFGIVSPFSSDVAFDSNNIEVSKGKCSNEGADPFTNICKKKIPGLPLNNYYKLVTYIEEVNPFSNFFELYPILHNNVCPSL